MIMLIMVVLLLGSINCEGSVFMEVCEVGEVNQT